MILHLFPVEAVGEVTAVVAIQGGGGRDSQGDALIGGAEQGGGVCRQMFLETGCVVVAQTGGLGAGFVIAGVDEIGGFPTGFGGEISEGQYTRAHHKGDKFLLISHKNTSFPV